jgi:hypothetical protein
MIQKTLHTVLIAVLFFLAHNKILGQKVYNYNARGLNCYSEMVFSETASDPKGVIVIDVQGENISKYSLSNKYLDSKLFTDYNLLYVNILDQGSSHPMNCYSAIISTMSASSKINKSSFYVIQKPKNETESMIKKTNEPQYDINLIYSDDTDLIKLRNALNRATLNTVYTQPIFQNNMVAEFEKKMENYKNNLDLGFHLSPTILTGNQLGLNKSAITPFGLSMAKNISLQNTVKVGITASFKIPNPKSIQSGLQSKVFSAVQNGDEQLYINERLSGHVLLGGDVSFKHAFTKTKPFRPYISAGLGFHSLRNISGQIQDTIDLSSIDLSNPSSLQGGLGDINPSDAGGALNTISSKFLVPQAEIGFDYRLTPVVKLNIALPFKYFADLSSTQNSTFAWGINMGLSFTLNPNKYDKIKVEKKK